MKKLFAAIAFATLIATPALAATVHHPAAPSSRQLYMSAPAEASAARDAAIHECNVEAAKWSNSAWESTQLATYGACMAEHGQQP
jgi:hypothetical protein